VAQQYVLAILGRELPSGIASYLTAARLLSHTSAEHQNKNALLHARKLQQMSDGRNNHGGPI
jgi:hypothetical protein